GQIIALVMDRSMDMVAAIWAVLKSGRAFLPVDPGLPAARIDYMLQNGGVKTVVASQHYASQYHHRYHTIDLSSTDVVDTSSVAEIKLKDIDEQQLAYVMYTSGTSGNPKGVMTTHRGVVSLVSGSGYVELNQSDVVLQLSDFGFDASTFEVWSAFANGAKLAIAPANIELSASAIGALLEQQQVSVAWFTRSFFDALYHQQNSLFNRLRYLLVGGEALTPRLMEQLVLQEQRPEHILNGYGPTESTTFTTIFPCHQFKGKYPGSVPLGKPISGRTVFVVDDAGRLAPIGAPGELYIGGAGLARGYLNQSELTNSQFVENLFTDLKVEGPDSRLYKTGDKVRWLHDGNLEYLGRNDFQVKVRGYRIETAEIEQVLLANDALDQVCVVARVFDEQNQLVAYCHVVDEAGFATVADYLAKRLPQYMIP
ncbi:MAG: amino acid adenylation domain-containing protein, partial [Psychrosphaera sp.]|nr:amino acid adenylation domain-containing protein [Psychrosphaera sp.]